ncbi:MAG: hypothetical protein ABGZ23_01135, partial [Fuerstiella sp.]
MQQSCCESAYAELLHKDWNTADRGFFTYAAKDAEATIRSWQRMKRRAVSWKTPAPFGMLTETLQTQASLALRQIEINGLQLDLQLAKSTEERFQLELRQTVETLQGDRVYFHDDQGQLRTLSAGRTSLGADDPFVAVSANRSAFRAVD